MTARTRFVLKLTVFVLLCVAFVVAVLAAHYSEQRKIDDTPHKPAVIDINFATMEEFLSLDGMTDTIAEHILAYRDRFILFSSVDELLEVDGVTKDLLNRWRPYLTL